MNNGRPPPPWERLTFALAGRSAWRRFRPCWLPDGAGVISRLGVTGVCTLLTPLPSLSTNLDCPAEEVLARVSDLVRHLKGDQLLAWLRAQKGTTLADNDIWDLSQLLRRLQLERIQVMASSLSAVSDRRHVQSSVARLQLELPEGNTLTSEQRTLLELLAGRPISDTSIPWVDILWVAMALVGMSVNEALALLPRLGELLLGIIRYWFICEADELKVALQNAPASLAYAIGETLELAETDPQCGALLGRIKVGLAGELLATGHWLSARRLLGSLDVGPFILTEGEMELSLHGAVIYREQVESIDKGTLCTALAVRHGYLGDREAAFFYWTEAACWQEAAQAAYPLVIDAVLRGDTLRLRDTLRRFVHYAGDLADLHHCGLLLVCARAYVGESSEAERDIDIQRSTTLLASATEHTGLSPVEPARQLAALSRMATAIFDKCPATALTAQVPLQDHFVRVHR